MCAGVLQTGGITEEKNGGVGSVLNNAFASGGIVTSEALIIDGRLQHPSTSTVPYPQAVLEPESVRNMFEELAITQKIITWFLNAWT